MKKIIFVFAFLAGTVSVSAQFGVGLYPTTSMIGLRWHPLIKTTPAAGQNVQYETNYKYHFELRSTFSYTVYGRGSQSVQPELMSFFRIGGGIKNEPELMTGVGIYYRYANGLSGNYGFLVPLMIEYAPQMKIGNHLILDAEMDLVGKVSGPLSLKLRPLLGISWLFDSPRVTASRIANHD